MNIFFLFLTVIYYLFNGNSCEEAFLKCLFLEISTQQLPVSSREAVVQ